MTELPTDADVQRVIDHELRLLTPRVRRSPGQMEELLHPELVEFGAWGRRWDRPSIVAALAEEPADEPGTSAHELTGTRIAEGAVLVTYVAQRGATRSRRSSLLVPERRRGAGVVLPPGHAH